MFVWLETWGTNPGVYTQAVSHTKAMQLHQKLERRLLMASSCCSWHVVLLETTLALLFEHYFLFCLCPPQTMKRLSTYWTPLYHYAIACMEWDCAFYFIPLFFLSLGPTRRANLFSVIFVEENKLKSIDLFLDLNSGSRSDSSKWVLKARSVCVDIKKWQIMLK